jgi:hypothetical protein
MAGMMILLILLGVCPFCVGTLFTRKAQKEWADSFTYNYMLGLMLLLAITELLSVPLTLTKASFSLYNIIYNALQLLLMGLALLLARKRILAIVKNTVFRIKTCDRRWGWIILGILLPVLILEFFTTYGYGDDKVYLAMVNDIVTSDRLYLTNIETGGTNGWVIAKYALSSYWVWIAYLVKMTGIHVLILCKSVLPWIFVPLGYAMQGLLGAYFFHKDERKIRIFLFFVILFTIFGGFSIYTVTYRFYTWVWQSKAFLAIIMLPFLFFYCNAVFEKKPTFREYLLLAVMNVAVCSTTLTGTGLSVAMVCVLAVIYAVVHRQVRIFFYTLLTCTPAFFLMVFYLKYTDILAKIHFYG